MGNKELLVDFFNSIAPLSEEERELIQNIIIRGSYRAKDYILMQGDVCNHIYFIKKGLVRFGLIDIHGNDNSLKFRAENEFVADFESFLNNQPSKRFIEAIEDVECLKIDRFGIQAIYDKTRYGDRIGRKIAENLFLDAHERIENFYKLSPEERYLKLVQTKGDLLNRIPQSYVATHVGIRPQSLSRIKRRLMEE